MLFVKRCALTIVFSHPFSSSECNNLSITIGSVHCTQPVCQPPPWRKTLIRDQGGCDRPFGRLFKGWRAQVCAVEHYQPSEEHDSFLPLGDQSRTGIGERGGQVLLFEVLGQQPACLGVKILIFFKNDPAGRRAFLPRRQLTGFQASSRVSHTTSARSWSWLKITATFNLPLRAIRTTSGPGLAFISRCSFSIRLCRISLVFLTTHSGSSPYLLPAFQFLLLPLQPVLQ